MPTRALYRGWKTFFACLGMIAATGDAPQAAAYVQPSVIAANTPANAPANTAVERERAALFQALKAARSELAGRNAEDAIWLFWMRSAPDPDIEKRISDAMRARREFDLDRAREILDDVLARAPAYAEGWNQRAFIHYLQGAPDKSLADIDRTLELEPKHFGALAGKARILMEQGRVELGQKALRQAVEIHPWLKERGLLLPQPKEEKI